jgi:hypothetical protein
VLLQFRAAVASPTPTTPAGGSPTPSFIPSPSSIDSAAPPVPSPDATIPPSSPSVVPTGTPANHADLILWLLVLGVIAAGVVIIFARNILRSGQSDPADSVIRSWIAIALVLGLLIFCAAALLGDNTSLQSTLFGGLIASTGAAIAFYFSSKGADQARADILTAASTLGHGFAKPGTFSSISLPDGTVDAAYSYRVIADGSPAPTYGVVSGQLPPGLTLETDGTLFGQPQQEGSATFVIAAANMAGFLVSPELTITIAPADGRGNQGQGNQGQGNQGQG